MACGCQVQGHGDVEGQREHGEVPLAEDGAQGTGEDGAGGRSPGDVVQEAADPDTRLSRGRVLPVPSWGKAGCLRLTGPEQSSPWASCTLSLAQ